MRKYKFRKKLIEGTIKSRPNRFIMVVDINGKKQKCYCPSTGRIGSIEFEDIPCLLSKSDNPNRKMPYTVEAFSLNPTSKKKKSWIGINQVQVNRYIEHFLRTGQLFKMIGKVEKVEAEVTLGKSRLDFLVNGKDYVEVKTLLRMIPTEGHPKHRNIPDIFTGYDRLIKHFGDIVRKTGRGSRAILVLCHTYDAKRFKVEKVKRANKIFIAAKKAQNKGMENWQINLKVDSEGVSLTKYFKLNLHF